VPRRMAASRQSGGEPRGAGLTGPPRTRAVAVRRRCRVRVTVSVGVAAERRRRRAPGLLLEHFPSSFTPARAPGFEPDLIAEHPLLPVVAQRLGLAPAPVQRGMRLAAQPRSAAGARARKRTEAPRRMRMPAEIAEGSAFRISGPQARTRHATPSSRRRIFLLGLTLITEIRPAAGPRRAESPFAPAARPRARARLPPAPSALPRPRVRFFEPRWTIRGVKARDGAHSRTARGFSQSRPPELSPEAGRCRPGRNLCPMSRDSGLAPTLVDQPRLRGHDPRWPCRSSSEQRAAAWPAPHPPPVPMKISTPFERARHLKSMRLPRPNVTAAFYRVEGRLLPAERTFVGRPRWPALRNRGAERNPH